MDIAVIDQVRLNFNAQGLMAINAAIGLMMFGVALDLKIDDFKRILVSPKTPAIGLAAQFLLLPAFTFLLTLILRPYPSMALGMILVAACPGGNLSNLITYLAKGNCAVSISMTAVSTAAAIVMTPLNLAVWGGLNPSTADILQRVNLSPFDVFVTIFIILGIPLSAGLVVGRLFPTLVDRVRRPFKIFSLIFFIAIVTGALVANWQHFLNYIGLVMFGVFTHNALALNLGYWSGRIFGLEIRDTRAVTIEVGIQNSGLGLVLAFNFFAGLGGMAIVVAWWGVWHIIAGLITAFIFLRQDIAMQKQQTIKPSAA
ncbi:MAG: bile acid:sodium symporter family protein [Desulfobacterales bacterium]|jgi:BASS family bile acid:Na+ symporter